MWRKRQTDSKTNVNILEITYLPFQSSFFLLFVNPVSKEQKFFPVPSFPLSSTPMEPPFGPSISTPSRLQHPFLAQVHCLNCYDCFQCCSLVSLS